MRINRGHGCARHSLYRLGWHGADACAQEAVGEVLRTQGHVARGATAERRRWRPAPLSLSDTVVTAVGAKVICVSATARC